MASNVAPMARWVVCVVLLAVAAFDAQAAQDWEARSSGCPPIDELIAQHPDVGRGGPITSADSVDGLPHRIGFSPVPYPREAQRARWEAVVMIAAVIETDGRTRTAAVVRSSVLGDTPLPQLPPPGATGFEPADPPLSKRRAGPMFERAAVQMAKGMRYRPLSKDGEPVRVLVCFPVNFTLRRAGDTRPVADQPTSVLIPTRSLCGREHKGGETVRDTVIVLRALATDSIPLVEKAESLRRVFAADSTFEGFFMNLCRLAARSYLTASEYHYLLDSVASAAAGPTADAAPAPSPEQAVLVAPPDSTVFDHFPRHTELRWNAVPRAARYVVEVEVWYDAQASYLPHPGLARQVVTEPAFTFRFVGAQPGRWRVRALNVNGVPGVPSPWRYFVYLN